MTLTIKLVRHGQSKANVGEVEARDVGDHTIELTPHGHEQARGVGRTLGAEAFAESYRLWKLDRAALDRAAPGISAWFDSAAFTDTLKKK